MNWKFGDNINTDLITPGRYNITTDPKELAKIAFIEHRPEFATEVKKGDFVIAGENFGCGSSRETAVTALKYCGVRAILATSYARIFYRNCMNAGLLALVVDTTDINEHDQLVLHIGRERTHTLENVSRGSKIDISVPPMMLKLYNSGGIISYIKKNGLDSISTLIAQ